MVVADGVSGDDANAGRKLRDHLRREFLAERDQQRVLALAARHKFVRAHDVIVFVEVHIVIAPRTLDHRRAQHARYQEFGLLHVSGSLRGMGLGGWGTGDSSAGRLPSKRAGGNRYQKVGYPRRLCVLRGNAY